MPDTSPLLMLVEDEPNIRELMSRILHYDGFEVLTAAHGQEALEILEELPRLPDLIILDLLMPIMDGWGFRKRQLLNPRIATLPTVFMTAGERICTQSLQIEPDQLVPKHLELDKFLHSILKNVPNFTSNRTAGFI